MEEFIFKLLESGGVVGAVIVIIVLNQRQMDARLKLWVEELEHRDTEWRDFLREQRAASVAVQEKISAELAANTSALRELVEASQKHHVFTQDSFDSVRRLLNKKPKRTAIKT